MQLPRESRFYVHVLFAEAVKMHLTWLLLKLTQCYVVLKTPHSKCSLTYLELVKIFNFHYIPLRFCCKSFPFKNAAYF